MPEARHCPDCRNEFVASVSLCSDCGRPLEPGELPRRPAAPLMPEVAGPDAGGDHPGEPEPPDTLVATLAGEDAERVARALTLENITSLLDCEGIQQLRGPHEPPKPAIARRKPVAIYVAHTRVDEAREIVDSLTGADLIGDQWRDAGEPDAGVVDVGDTDAATRAAVEAVQRAAVDLESPQAEGGLRYLVALAAFAAVLALFIALL